MYRCGGALHLGVVKKMSDSRALQRAARGGIHSVDLQPARCALLRIVSNTVNWCCACAISVLSLRLQFCCIFFGCGGIGCFEIVLNGAPEHEPCIFKFFLLPRLVTRIKEFKIKESVVVCQTTDAERN